MSASQPSTSYRDHLFASLYANVDRALERGQDWTHFRWNGLVLVAVTRANALELPVPDQWVNGLSVQRVYGTFARAFADDLHRNLGQPFLLFKGPEHAGLYPLSEMRSWGDLDVVAKEMDRASSVLVEHGYADNTAHHEGPEGERRYFSKKPFPLTIEMHPVPDVQPWMPAFSFDALLERAIPSRTGLAGVLTLSPEDDAIASIAHAWRHGALTSVGRLVDIALLIDRSDRSVLERRVREMRIGRVFGETERVIDALFFDGRPTISMRTWAAFLPDMRVPTLTNHHICYLMGALYAEPAYIAPVHFGKAFAQRFVPSQGQSWRARYRRIAGAFGRRSHPFGIGPQRPASRNEAPTREEST